MSNLYQRKPGGNWWLRAMVDGREHRRSLQTVDRRLAGQRAKVELERLTRRRWGDERRSWKEAVIAWAESGHGLKPQTVRRYLTSLAAIKDVLEPLHLDEIDRAVLARIASRPGVTNATRRRDLTAVSVILHAAEERGWLKAVPSYSSRRLKERRDPIALPPAAEIERLHGELSPMLSRLVRLLEQTGMRLEEAGGLTWAQVDPNRKVVQLTDTKARRPRAVPLSDEALGTISGTPRHLACDFVFWHSPAAPSRYMDLSNYLRRARDRAGVAWRIHDLRHLFAVRYLQAGGSLYQLQQILGHSSIAVTERYLFHLTPAEQARAKGVA